MIVHVLPWQRRRLLGRELSLVKLLRGLYRRTEVDHVIQHWGLFSCCIFKASCGSLPFEYGYLSLPRLFPPEQYSFVLSLVVKGSMLVVWIIVLEPCQRERILSNPLRGKGAPVVVVVGEGLVC